MITLLMSGILMLQTAMTVTTDKKAWNFNLKSTVKSLTCDKTELGPGDQSICTITLNQPASSSGYMVNPYKLDASGCIATGGCTGGTLTPTSLLVPAGATTATFTVTMQ